MKNRIAFLCFMAGFTLLIIVSVESTREIFYPRVDTNGLVVETNLVLNATDLARMIFEGVDRQLLIDGMRLMVKGKIESIKFDGKKTYIELGPPYIVKFGLIEVKKTVKTFFEGDVRDQLKKGEWILIRGTYTVQHLIATGTGQSIWIVYLEDCEIITKAP